MSYVEASLAASASSGASNSGATNQKGGGNFGGLSYGPGSLILGQEAIAETQMSWKSLLVIAAVIAAFALGWSLFKKGAN